MRNSNTKTVELPADSIPDAIASGEQTFEEYIGERLTANRDSAQKERTVNRVVANSTEYDEGDRAALKRTPLPVLEKVARNVTGLTSATPTANTGDDDVDADDFGAGVIE